MLPCVCWNVEVNYPLWTGVTNVFILYFAGAIHHCLYMYTLCHGSVLTFSIKAKWLTNALWDFAVQSLTVAYLCTSVPLGHSIVDQVPEKFDGNSATDAWGDHEQLFWTPPYIYRCVNCCATVTLFTRCMLYLPIACLHDDKEYV